jgi:hypothetical protein
MKVLHHSYDLLKTFKSMSLKGTTGESAKKVLQGLDRGYSENPRNSESCRQGSLKEGGNGSSL